MKKMKAKQRRQDEDRIFDLYGESAVFIDPKGVPHASREEICLDPSVCRRVGEPCASHDCFAFSRLAREGRKPGEEAVTAAKATGNDFQPYECQLILDGWVRGRNCGFTARSWTKDSLWSVALAAKARAHLCGDKIYTDLLAPIGLVRGQTWTVSSIEQAAELAGLRRGNRRRR